MKKQLMALSLTTAIVANPLTAALATDSLQNKVVTMEQMLQINEMAKKETGVDLQQVLKSVEEAKKRLEIIRESKETDPVLVFAQNAEFAVLSFNAAAAAIHTKNSKITTAVVFGSALTSVMNAGVNYYKTVKNRGEKFDSRALGKEIAEAVHALKQSGLEQQMGIELSDDVEQIRNDLESVSSAINMANDLTPGEFRTKDNIQAAGAMVALGASLAHIIAPRIGMNIEKEEAIGQRVLQFLRNYSAGNAKKHSAAGGTVAGFVEGYDMVIGMQSPQVTKILNDTFDNMNKATLNLKRLIKGRQPKA